MFSGLSGVASQFLDLTISQQQMFPATMLTNATDVVQYDCLYKTYKNFISNWRSPSFSGNTDCNSGPKELLCRLANSRNVVILLIFRVDIPLNSAECFGGYRHEMYFPGCNRPYPFAYSSERWYDCLQKFPDMLASCHSGCSTKFESIVRKMSNCLKANVSILTNICLITMFLRAASEEGEDNCTAPM
ncbi:MAG: hypothetical protein LBI81_01680 [Puniceicoccales bacterium]|jgi:hypothetical protein|nr:hypothetical protein [Puniceicoccales bacterium]